MMCAVTLLVIMSVKRLTIERPSKSKKTIDHEV
jgi:hypothetical protein